MDLRVGKSSTVQPLRSDVLDVAYWTKRRRRGMLIKAAEGSATPIGYKRSHRFQEAAAHIYAYQHQRPQALGEPRCRTAPTWVPSACTVFFFFFLIHTACTVNTAIMRSSGVVRMLLVDDYPFFAERLDLYRPPGSGRHARVILPGVSACP